MFSRTSGALFARAASVARSRTFRVGKCTSLSSTSFAAVKKNTASIVYPAFSHKLSRSIFTSQQTQKAQSEQQQSSNGGDQANEKTADKTTNGANQGNNVKEGEKPQKAEISVEQLSTQLAKLQESLKKKEEEAARLQDKYIRAVAEAENIRTRGQEDVKAARMYAVQDFAKTMLEVADNLSLALANMPQSAKSPDNPELKSIYDGIVLVEQVLTKCLNKHGVAKVESLSKKFDPNIHECLFQIPIADKDPGTIAQVLKDGYTLHGRILRSAAVGVVKAPPSQ